MRRLLHAALFPAPALAALAVLGGPAGAQSFDVLQSPCPLPGTCPDQTGASGGFGHRVVTLDFDGDGALDLAVGEPGRDAVYVYRGPDLFAERPLVFTPSGLVQVCPQPVGDYFGGSVAKGDIDGIPGEELFVGAPKSLSARGEVYVLSRDGSVTPLLSMYPAVGEFGNSIAVGDLDGDTLPDVAVGAARSSVGGFAAVGTVHVFSSLLGVEVVLANPAFAQNPAVNGYYGGKIKLADTDGDGALDMLVSAIGNHQPAGLYAGALYVHRSPVVAPQGIPVPPPLRLDDPDVVPCDFGPRYAKGFDARDGLILIGAQRKEPVGGTCVGGQEDTGGAYLFTGKDYTRVAALPDTTPSYKGLFGFDVSLVDLDGDEKPSAVVVALEDRELHIYDPGDPAAAPLVVPVPAGAVYWAFGTTRGDLDAQTPGEELVLGDPRANSCAGRVLIFGM